jgi:Na+/glutamate symporter
MSGHGFHVHGPHEHEMEHVAQHGAGEGHASQLAVLTAILATVGALFGYMAGATQANAGLYKNDAAIKKTEASNQWNYYQAKSSKQNLSELAAELAPEGRRPFYLDEVKRYKGEKAEIQTAAKKLEDESTEWDRRSEQEMHTHHRWAQGMTALQVAIAMAAIALLTKRKLFEYLVYGFGVVGVLAGGLAWLHI